MARLARSLALVAVALAASAVHAEDPPPTVPSAAAPEELFTRMAELYKRALRDPAKPDDWPREAGEEPPPLANRIIARDKDVAALASAGDDYVRALDGRAPEAVALFYRGAGHALRASRDAVTEMPRHFGIAAESLEAYLAATDEKAEFRADAERWLGRSLVHLGRLDEAVTHLDRAIKLLQKAGRRDEAGVSAYDALVSLQAARRDADFAALASAIDAEKADFGASTPTIRKLAAASRFTVGAPLPKLPAVLDVDGAKIEWTGRPTLVHFFLAGYANGMPSATREIELELIPIAAKFRKGGLALVGVSMDYERPKEQADDLRKKWEEWGRKAPFQDGSLASVRDFATKAGIAWPWYWDGKSMQNPISLALGGVGVTSPYAVLLDAEGVVRWKGDAPFDGLEAEIAKLVKDAK